MAHDVQARRQQILAALRTEGYASVVVLAQRLAVSELTVRHDLTALERDGQVSRTHGGAVLHAPHQHTAGFRERLVRQQAPKRAIAQAAARRVVDNDTLIFDASTTAYYIAEHLTQRKGLTIFTNGIDIGLRLAENPSSTVVLTGGIVRRESASVGSQIASQALRDVRVNTAFLSCTGWSADLDPMEDDLFETQIKTTMSQVAAHVVLLADSSKFSRFGLTSFTTRTALAELITDDAAPPDALAQLRQAGVVVTVCKVGASG